MTNIFLDRRFLVNGRNSHIKLSDSFNLTKYVDTLISNNSNPGGSSYTFLNGITELNGLVKLGGALTDNITNIQGSPIISTSFYFGGGDKLNNFGVICSEDIDMQGNNVSAAGDSSVTLTESATGKQIRIANSIPSGIELKTTAQLAGNVKPLSVFTLEDVNSGEGEWRLIKFTDDFEDFEFIGGQLVFPATTHNKGSEPLVQLYLNNGGGNYSLIYPGSVELQSTNINSAGDITLTVNAGEEFNGKIIVL